MDIETLTAIGRALYGDQWQSPLSRDLGVSDRTMRRWVAGEFQMPDGVAGDLRRLIAARIKALKQCAALL